MTHTVDIIRDTNHPDHIVLVRLNITSLDSAGVEQFDPVTEVDDDTKKSILGADVPPSDDRESLTAVSVLEWEDETLQIMWDTLDEEFKVKSLSDGTDVANNTDVGEVLIEVHGE